jgi:hypothetical protein
MTIAEPVGPLTVTDSYGRVHRASQNEYNFAMACVRLELVFKFQVDFFNGRRMRGGQVLDFMVETPFPEACQVFGEYWHEGLMGAEDSYKLSVLRNAIGGEVYVFWGQDTETVEDCVAAIKSQLKV